MFLAMVPQIDGWTQTYSDARIASEAERLLHFGQAGHVRCDGADFAARVERSGLPLRQEVVAFGADCVRYGILRGQKAFPFEKA